MGKFIKPETDVKSINRNDYKLYVNYGNGDILFSAGHKQVVYDTAAEFAQRGVRARVAPPTKTLMYTLHVRDDGEWAPLLTAPANAVRRAARVMCGVETKVSCA